MSSGITRLDANAMPTEVGKQSDRQSAANASQPILRAVVALMHDRPNELQDARKQLEREVRTPGPSEGLLYSMLGEVDAKLAQGVPSHFDKAI